MSDPLDVTLGQLGLSDLFEKSKVDPSRAFSRSDWSRMLPVIKKFQPEFGQMLEVLLDPFRFHLHQR